MSDPDAQIAAPVTTPGSDDRSGADREPSREVLQPDTVRGPGADGVPGGEDDGDDSPEVESPAKIIRIGAMLKQLLDEARSVELDEAARVQLGAIYEHSVAQLKTAMSPELGEELEDLSFDFSEGSTPSEAELRMAKAQLVGWLEGLFHGIQATLMAQQMAARQQLEGMRAQLPERSGPIPGGPGYI
jgi:hypothetical protein